VKPRYVADLPERRVDDREARPKQLGAAQISDQRERAVARIGEPGDQLLARGRRAQDEDARGRRSKWNVAFTSGTGAPSAST
jgi:hypothetical protein